MTYSANYDLMSLALFDRVVTKLMNDIRGHMGCLYNLTDCVALLDMLASFATSCTLSQYGKLKPV